MISVKDFAEALQQLAAEHGEEEIVSIGAARGQIDGLENPFVIHTRSDDMYYLPSEAIRHRFTIEKTLSHQAVKKLRKWLDPDTPSDQLPKNAFTIVRAVFSDNRDMEVRYCTSYSGSSWVEAVLVTKGTGYPLTRTDARFGFLGEWTIQCGNTLYTLVLSEGEA